MTKIRLDGVYKVFGPDPSGVVERLRAGEPRDRIQEETGAVAAVIDASFEVPAGEIFVVMGLSGSGKSTLVRAINLLHRPTVGTVEVDGTELTALNAKELRRIRSEKISMVFQHFALFPHRTVLENVGWGLEVRKATAEQRRERSLEALTQVGLSGWDDSYPDQLSGGMQQRVGLARALATDADILLMDEAFSALDPLIRREMQEQLLELQERLQRTIVFITHDLNEAMSIGDRIAMMKDGRIVQIGTAEDILSEPANDYVATFVRDVDRSRVLTASTVMEAPAATIGVHESTRAAMRAMQEHQVSALFVVGPHGRLRGTVSDDVVSDAVTRGVVKLDELLESEVATTAPDTPLVELFVPAAESPLPLAVVDDEGFLRGVIPRVTLLTAAGAVATADGSSSGNGSDAEAVPEGTLDAEAVPEGTEVDAGA